MTGRRSVLFVDDEAFYARPYREALESEFDVTFVEKADVARQEILERPKLSAVVLDIMMPCPSGIASTATGHGLETGVWVLRETRERLVDFRMPVVVLSNKSKSSIERMLEPIGFPRGFVLVCQKVDTRASQLPQLVKSQIDVFG